MFNQADRNNWKSVLLGIPVAALELFLFYLSLKGQLSFVFFSFLHILILSFLIFHSYVCYKRHVDLRFPILLTFAIFGGGPFGACGFLLFALLFPLFSYFSSTPDMWFNDLFPEHKDSAFVNIYQRVKSGWDDYSHMNEVATFQDLFLCGNLSQKQAVLDTIVHNFIADYAPILKEALADPHNSIRIQAAAIMSRIDIDFSDQLAVLLAQSKRDVDNPQTQWALAEHYDKYATLGILDSVREKEIGENAIIHYKEYLRLVPKDPRVKFAIGRLLFQMEEYEPFLEWYERYRKEQTHIPTIVQNWYMHALYKLKRFDMLAQNLKGR